MTLHYQAALPKAWVLTDEVTLPGGRMATGTTARVYQLLELTRRHGHQWRVGRHLAPAGWVPTWVLREPWAGGSAGDRRLRDLREKHGLSIESRAFQVEDDAPDSKSWLWALGEVGRVAAASTAPAAVGAVGKGPLAGITVVLRRGAPDLRAGAVEISPGAPSRLAPSLAALDDEAYRSELRARHRAGQLAGTLASRRDWVLWIDPEALYDPRPVLGQVVTTLGGSIASGDDAIGG